MRTCKHCTLVLRYWVNMMGSVTYWCDSCDSPNKPAG